MAGGKYVTARTSRPKLWVWANLVDGMAEAFSRVLHLSFSLPPLSPLSIHSKFRKCSMCDWGKVQLLVRFGTRGNSWTGHVTDVRIRRFTTGQLTTTGSASSSSRSTSCVRFVSTAEFRHEEGLVPVMKVYLNQEIYLLIPSKHFSDFCLRIWTISNYLHGLWNLTAKYSIHMDSPIISTLSRINPIPRVDTHFFEIYPNIELPRKILEWYPPGRRRKGRPRNSWMQEVTTRMRESGELETWNASTDRGRERKLIYLRHRNMWKHDTLYINK